MRYQNIFTHRIAVRIYDQGQTCHVEDVLDGVPRSIHTGQIAPSRLVRK
ncbi:MAG: hypothetical protein ABSB35_01745 [Bryobacteraceae bacterium]|jgi:hypothetical protein